MIIVRYPIVQYRMSVTEAINLNILLLYFLLNGYYTLAYEAIFTWLDTLHLIRHIGLLCLFSPHK